MSDWDSRRQQAESWEAVFNLCDSLGMDGPGTGEQMVLDFIRKLAARSIESDGRKDAVDGVGDLWTFARKNGADSVIVHCPNPRAFLDALHNEAVRLSTEETRSSGAEEAEDVWAKVEREMGALTGELGSPAFLVTFLRDAIRAEIRATKRGAV